MIQDNQFEHFHQIGGFLEAKKDRDQVTKGLALLEPTSALLCFTTRELVMRSFAQT